MEIYSSAFSTHTNFYFCKKTKNPIYCGISKFNLWTNFGKFCQFWVVLGRICCIGSGCLHARTLAKIYKKPHNF
jgi:hypothetical protein